MQSTDKQVVQETDLPRNVRFGNQVYGETVLTVHSRETSSDSKKKGGKPKISEFYSLPEALP